MTQSPIESSHWGADTDSFLMTICQYRERDREGEVSLVSSLCFSVESVRRGGVDPGCVKLPLTGFYCCVSGVRWRCDSVAARVVLWRRVTRAGQVCRVTEVESQFCFKFTADLWRCRGGDTPLWSSVSLRFLNWHEFHTWSSQVRDAVNNKRILE